MAALKGKRLEDAIRFGEATNLSVEACEVDGPPAMAFLDYSDTLLSTEEEAKDLATLYRAWEAWEEAKRNFNRKYR